MMPTAISYFDNFNDALPAKRWAKSRRIGPLCIIILLHVLLCYAIIHGQSARVLKVLPTEIVVTLMAPMVLPSQTTPIETATLMKPAIAPLSLATALTVPSVPEAISLAPLAAAPADVAVVTALPIPPLPPSLAQPKTVTSGVEYVRQPQASYPRLAKRMKEEGQTLLRVLVNAKGLPERVEIQKSSGSGRLDEAARQAVMAALFKPHVEDGIPMAMYALVPISFQLDS